MSVRVWGPILFCVLVSLNSKVTGFVYFRYNLEDFYPPPPTIGMELRQPIWAPARVLVNLTVWAFIFLVPILYWRIFKFRNTQVATAGVHVSQMYLSYKINDFNDKLVGPVNLWNSF